MTSAHFVEALGWTLVHSFWQLALIGAGTALLLSWAGPARLRLQHGLAWAAFLACFLWPLATFLRHLIQPGSLAPLPMPRILAAYPVTPPPGALGGPMPWPHTLEALLFRALPWIASLWALGAAGMALRLGGGWFAARNWRFAAQPAPLALEERLHGLASRMGVSARVALRISARLATPVVLGLWRPMVLLPASLLTALPEPYLEAILAHELAHVLRRDYLLNLLQNLLEVLLFHHPTVWWLSRRIRNLREHLADDLAATAIGEPRRLALALDALDDLMAVRSPHPHLVLAARGGTLFDRIQRLVIPPTPRPRPAWLPASLLALALPCAALSLSAAAEPLIPADPVLLAELDTLATREGLDPQLLRAMAWTESNLKRTARSPQGALGVLQVMPATARKYGATNLDDPSQVMAAGARYLRVLLDRYHGDVHKAVSAYNGGEEAVDAGRLTEETRAYTPVVMSVYEAKAVRPAPPLPEVGLDGVVRRAGDGTWRLMPRISSRGEFRLEVMEDRPEGKTLAAIQTGSRPEPAPAPERQVSLPVLTFKAQEGTPIVLRLTDTATGHSGEAHLRLEGAWNTFALSVLPKD